MTHFASAERSTTQRILEEFNIAGSQKFFPQIFGAMTGVGAVLDKNRQIIYANDEFLSLLGLETLEPLLGKRPGEVISCVNSNEEGGCGTTKACAYCGVVKTILESQATGLKATSEAFVTSILDGKYKTWNFNVISTPVAFNGDIFYVLVLQDISEAVRRASLERIFFHDLLNSVGGLYGLITVMKDETNPKQRMELIELSEKASMNIIEEIMIQRQLRDAENGELRLNIELIKSIGFLDSAISKIGFHESGRERSIVRDPDSVNIDFETDRILFQRVIINLLKNALEETDMSGRVTTGIKSNGDEIIFWVKNDKVMSEEVKIQIFNKSFSTKGIDRGLGTHSIRLLTENYLKGKVSFESNESVGTIFRIALKTEYPEF